MDRRTVVALAAEIGPRAAWLARVEALGSHEEECTDCWRRRSPRCEEGKRLLAAEEDAYRVLADARAEVSL